MASFEPEATLGITKYGPNGLFTLADFDQFGLKPSHKKLLETAANYSLSKKSWSSYKTAEKMLRKCQEETGTSIKLPMKEKDVLLFLAWLMERGLQARTISTYLSGIRMLHLRCGCYVPTIRSELVKQILEGRIHIDAVSRRLEEKPIRLPVTPTILKLIKLELKSSDLSKEDKRLLWVVATVGFAGGFRVHELLAVREAKFDPLFTLLGSDIAIKAMKLNGRTVETIQIKLKSQKTDRIGVDMIVDVYESGGALCPVRACKKWMASSSQLSDSKPAFRLGSGKPLTGKKYNSYLKKLLEKHLNYEKERITSHSFRAGIATLMGQMGFADQEIQALGRWSSKAFEAYLKLPRTKRLEMARQIGRLGL